MLISLKWLNEFIDVSDFFDKPHELAEKLNRSGIEVESITDPSLPFRSVVVGQIRELVRHPNADRLTLCQVDVGGGVTKQIVCGAKNHKVQDKVVVALPGAVLPGDFAIKASKIRDVESLGMLCSEKELGLKAESEGILILPADSPVGTSFAEYQGLNDIIFDLSVSPNRADVLSHFGLARELKALLGRSLQPFAMDWMASDFSTEVKVEVVDKDLCPRYAGRSVRNVQVGPSPWWLAERLEKVGVKSINNVVDVTNYVMMELGQPLHAFDADLISGRALRVGRAKSGDSFTSLDGTEFRLTGDELVIGDDVKALALAGVVGGQNSGVSLKTKHIFLESAFFIPETVRRTSRRLGVETASSYRFARGTDPEGVILALDRACELLKKVAGDAVEIAKNTVDVRGKFAAKPEIAITVATVSERLGFSVPEDEFVSTIERLGSETKKKGEEWQVLPPSYRVDLNQAVDLIEEYARLKGYEHIPESFPPLKEVPTPHAKAFVKERRLRRYLQGEGYHQAINYGFLADSKQKVFLTPELSAAGAEVRVKNPLSDELNVMRKTLLPGLFQNLLSNYRYGKEQGRLFELGSVFFEKDGEFVERSSLGLAAWGQMSGLWEKGGDRPVVYDVKSALENVCLKLRVKWEWRTLKNPPEFFHPMQAAELFVEGRRLGAIGTLHPEFGAREKIRGDVALAEIDAESLMRGQPRGFRVEALSKFPIVERDLAFVLPSSTLAGDVTREIKKSLGKLLKDIRVVDVFTGGTLPADHRSVAFRMILQDADGTLSEERLSELQNQVIADVQKSLEVHVRAT